MYSKNCGIKIKIDYKITIGKPERVLCFVRYLRSTVIVVMLEIVLCNIQVGV